MHAYIMGKQTIKIIRNRVKYVEINVRFSFKNYNVKIVILPTTQKLYV